MEGVENGEAEAHQARDYERQCLCAARFKDAFHLENNDPCFPPGGTDSLAIFNAGAPAPRRGITAPPPPGLDRVTLCWGSATASKVWQRTGKWCGPRQRLGFGGGSMLGQAGCPKGGYAPLPVRSKTASMPACDRRLEHTKASTHVKELHLPAFNIPIVACRPPSTTACRAPN
jgi:hypothetical protein